MATFKVDPAGCEYWLLTEPSYVPTPFYKPFGLLDLSIWAKADVIPILRNDRGYYRTVAPTGRLIALPAHAVRTIKKEEYRHRYSSNVSQADIQSLL